MAVRASKTVSPWRVFSQNLIRRGPGFLPGPLLKGSPGLVGAMSVGMTSR